MTLRARLFLLFGGLVALLVLGQWAMVSMLNDRLSTEVGEVAVSVGRGLVTDAGEPRVLRLSPDPGAAPGQPSRPGARKEATVELKPLPGGDTARTGRQIAVLEMEEPDGTTWVQEVVRLEDPGQEEGVATGDATAVFTYQISVDTPRGAHSLLVQGPGGGRAIPIPGSGVQRAVEQAGNRLLMGTGLILVLGLLTAGLVAHRVSAPLRGLAGAARRLGDGEMGVHAPEQGGGEVREAIASFNRMSSHLQELDESNRRLRAREHLGEIGEIARGLAHTLRNPLNALGLAVEELAARSGEGASGPADDLAQGARRQIRRIDGAIRSFLALASEGGGRLEEVDVAALAQDVALEAAQDAGRDVALEVLDPGQPGRLRAVAPELRAVIQALVVNAVEASPEGGRVRIGLQDRPEGPGCRIVIDDDGKGVPAEVKGRLFTPHVTTKAHGSGMGLYLAQRIAATRYGGSVRLEDRPEGGTRAVLDLGPREEGGRG